MDLVKKYPVNYSLWLLYGASFYSANLNSLEFARWIYSLDFLYGGSAQLQENEVHAVVEAMLKISNYIQLIQQKKLQTCTDFSPKQELVNFLFAVNLYEDIVQELRYLYGIDRFPPIDKIFQSVEKLDSVAELVLPELL